MKTNQEFLTAIYHSFKVFVDTGTSRSTAKLKPLHGFIANDIAERLGNEFSVMSQGYGSDREADIQGRYVDKMVDITIKKNGEPLAGIAVKFIMQNYSQNSVNYFENMLGETANIRCNRCPYFQIFISLDTLPYYKRGGEISKWETLTMHNMEKYKILSHDNSAVYMHTPDKMLIFIVHVPDNKDLNTRREYMQYYKNLNFRMKVSEHEYSISSRNVILNDYEDFMRKVYYQIMSL